MLKSIELIGFKSFAKRGKLDFTHPVTAIVGPNGSGKSNTAEAFRFVLGEQGSKAMRVKKGTDLIWGGSRAVPKASRAGVRMVLDNSSGRLGIDFTEVVIERLVLADGTHEYTINGAKVRLKDIQNLLAGANIGSTGHHIISQGQADRILAATPRERREMLEDALGLKGYILRKAEAERKLTSTNDNLIQVQSSVRELLPRLKYLKRQAVAVEEARKLKTSLEHDFAVYLGTESAWVSAELAETATAISAPQEELSNTDKRIEQLKEELTTIELQTNDGAVSEAELAGLATAVSEAQSALESAKQELGKVLGQIELLNSMQERGVDRPETVPREAVRAILLKLIELLDKGHAEQAKDRASKFITKVLDAGQQMEDSSATLDKERLAKLQKSKHTIETRIVESRKALVLAQANMAAAQSKESDSVQESTTLERDIYKEVANRNELVGVLAEIEHRQAAAKSRQRQLEEDVAEVEALLGKHIRESASSTSSESDMSRQDIERLKLRVESTAGVNYEVVDEYRAAQEEYEHLNEQVQDLTQAIGKLSGLMGTLDKQARERFNTGLSSVNARFSEFFSMLFGGGGAMLELEHASEGGDKPGVVASVELPRKKVTTLETLSGGERALASIALIFAMSQVNPPPFIILDETDAALDEANSRKYAEVVQRLSDKSQVILITHNRATMAVADTLYGVTMGNDGVSKLLSVQLESAEQYAK